MPRLRFVAGYRTYLVKVSPNIRSKPPRKNPAANASAITMAVRREVSSLLGHVDLRSSEIVSCRNWMGRALPPVPGEIIRAAPAGALAMGST